MVLCPSGASGYQPAVFRGHYYFLLSFSSDLGFGFPCERSSLKSAGSTCPLAPIKVAEARMRAPELAAASETCFSGMLVRAQPPCPDRKVPGARGVGYLRPLQTSSRGKQGQMTSQSRCSVSDVSQCTSFSLHL